MKKGIAYLLALVLIVTSLSACRSKNQVKAVEEPVSLSGLQQELNSEREKALKKPIAYKAEDYTTKLDTKEFTEEELKQLQTMTGKKVDEVTKQQAISDVDMLFRMMQSSYAGYVYFGGDEVFNPAKQKIIDEINDSEGETVKVSWLKDTLLEDISFIEDSHFRINMDNIKFAETYYYSVIDSREFHKDSLGYYTNFDSGKWYLDKDMVKYIMRTIADSGEIVYGLVALSKESEKKNLPTVMKLYSGDKIKEYEIKWELQKEAGTATTDKVYTNKKVDEIPVITLSNMEFSESFRFATNQFINSAKKLKDEKVFIVDLRHNGGGTGEIAQMWLYNLTGKLLALKSTTVERSGSSLNQYLHKINYREIKDQFDFLKEHPELIQQLVDSWNWNLKELPATGEYMINEYTPTWTKRDGTIFVLVDKDAVSCGEIFIKQLQAISNVVVVGTNSNGCLSFAGVSMITGYLPNSQLEIGYGKVLILTDDTEGFETRGCLPDIFVGGQDALQAAVKCYQYYND
jgi:hypothetical protein